MLITVLGSGPTGMAVAYAAISRGHKVTMITRDDFPSTLYGCQYLHAPILPARETVVAYKLNGTPEAYRAKVYGSNWQGKVSPEDRVGEHSAWDIRETYRQLRSIVYQEVHTIIADMANPEHRDMFIKDADLVISTIPAPALCGNRRHVFKSQRIWACGSVTETYFPDEVECNGTSNVSWYRMSCVFGHRTMEWAEKPEPNMIPDWCVGNAVLVSKPLSTDCDCLPDIVRVGRYGAWDKSQLVHTAYAKAIKGLEGE